MTRDHHGGRGRGRGGFRNSRSSGLKCYGCNREGHKRADCHKFEKTDNEWHENVRQNHDQELDLDFKEYTGEKRHELPQEFLALLNETKTRAESKEFLLETEFGIEKYLSNDCAGFNGILKHRFSDFLVHEIDKTGKVVRLTDFDLPKDDVQDKSALIKIPEFKDLSDSDKKLIGQLSWTRILQLAKKSVEALINSKSNNIVDLGEVKIDVTSKNKEERTEYHKVLKKHFPCLTSNTANEGEKKFFVVKPTKPPTNGAEEWPRDRPKHLTFHLSKQSTDTAQIFGQLARVLSVHNSKFHVAGTKDRRAITTQKVCVSWVTAKKLLSAMKGIRNGNNVKVGNFSYEKEDIELGDLQGNLFTIILRNIEDSIEDIEKSLNSLKEVGFINYFGHQRFGTSSSVKTSDIGLALIKSQWKTAVELILKPRPNESVPMTKMRCHFWIYRNPADALVLLGNRMSQSRTIEATLLQGLSKMSKENIVDDADDYVYIKGFDFLQKNTLLMYLHSYQSLIWNKAVSKRLEMFGQKVLVGDLVLSDENQFELSEKATKSEQRDAKLIEITEENINEFSLYDVVMPIPGFKVSYPNNDDLKKIYLDLMQEDGLEDGFKNLKHKRETFALPGDYRKVLNKPKDMKWNMINHDDPGENLLVSDDEIMNGAEHKKSLESGQHRALCLEFSLNSSTYATMALREAMKVDLGKGSQTELTEKFKSVTDENKRKLEENGAENGSSSPKRLKTEKPEDEEEAAKQSL